MAGKDRSGRGRQFCAGWSISPSSAFHPWFSADTRFPVHCLRLSSSSCASSRDENCMTDQSLGLLSIFCLFIKQIHVFFLWNVIFVSHNLLSSVSQRWIKPWASRASDHLLQARLVVPVLTTLSEDQVGLQVFHPRRHHTSDSCVLKDLTLPPWGP